MEYKFIIQGRLDGLNEYTAANRTNPYKGGEMKADNERIVMLHIRRHLRNLHICNPVCIDYVFHEKNKKRDLDNISSFAHKVIQDSLVKTGVLAGDGWRHITGYSDVFKIDKDNPRIEVTIKEVIQNDK